MLKKEKISYLFASLHTALKRRFQNTLLLFLAILVGKIQVVTIKLGSTSIKARNDHANGRKFWNISSRYLI